MCVPAVVLWMSLEALGEEVARSAHLIGSTVPLSYVRPANMEVPVGEGRVSQVTVQFQAGGPDVFQQEGIWLVKDKERTPVKRLTRVRFLFRTSQFASEVHSQVPGSHSESRTVCGQSERPPQTVVSLS